MDVEIIWRKNCYVIGFIVGDLWWVILFVGGWMGRV